MEINTSSNFRFITFCGVFLLLFLIVGFESTAQIADFESEKIKSLSEERLKINKNGMLILGGWSVANIAAGIALGLNKNNPNKDFFAMGGMWNAVNLGIAAFSLNTISKTVPISNLLMEISEQSKIESILLFNAGLDIAYITAGGLLIQRSLALNNNNSDRLKGYGQNLIMQGAFLLIFDSIMYVTLHKHGLQLFKIT
jgi:hypothetical protein